VCVFITSNSSTESRPPVRNADLADVVQRGRPANDFHLARRDPQALGQQRRRPADPLGVLPGFVVPELGGAGEPFQDLDPRPVQLDRPARQLDGALAHPLLQPLVLILQRQMEEPGLEQVADPEAHLDGTERLGQEVPRSARERAALGFAAAVRGEHQDRQVRLGRDLLPEDRQDLEPGEVRHLEVQQNEIRMMLVIQIHRPPWVRGGDESRIPFGLEDPTEHLDVHLLVVDHEDASVPPRRYAHERHL
jgi:hypothetical protein